MGWDFMLAQKSNRHFRRLGADQTEALSSLPVTRWRGCQVAQVDLFATDPLSGINIVAFYQPRYTQSGDGRMKFAIWRHRYRCVLA